jgi:Na+-translocating ferredoxin:NAD+ oxidoreductase subunit D
MSSHSTHQLQPRLTQQLMHRVVLACLPALLIQFLYFGWGIVLQLLIASSSGLLFEALSLWLRNRPMGHSLTDGSVLLSGVLLALAMPPLAPWWLAVIGMLFAIGMAKQLYGGLGHNLFNPAMVGYVALLVAFPGPMSACQPSLSNAAARPGLVVTSALIFQTDTAKQKINSDAVTKATPLERLKRQQRLEASTGSQRRSSVDQKPLDSAWLAVNMSFLLGGLLLLAQGIIQWHIPGSLLASLLLSATLGEWFNPLASGSPLLQLFSGSTMCGAFFIATDPVTAAATVRGRLLFGALIGLLVYLIRRFGDYPDGLAFAVLIANMLVPLFDRTTQPRIYGQSLKR